MNLVTDVHNVPSYMYSYETFDERFRASMWDHTLVITQSWVDTVKSLFANPQPYSAWIVAVLVLTMIGIAGLLYKGDKRTAQGKKMQRDKQLRILVSDAITDAVEQLRYEDKITRSEKLRIYKDLAKAMALPDLVPVHPNKTKHDIKYRLGNGIYKTKPNIPGDPPPVIEITPKPRKLGAIRSLIHKTV